MEKIKCESCGHNFYRDENENRNMIYRNSKKCPSCRSGVPPWTKEEIDYLVHLRRNTDYSVMEIAKKIGRTRDACSNKLIKMRVRKNFLGEYRKVKCILCEEEYKRFAKCWALIIKDKFVCDGCRKAFGKTKRIDDIIFIRINKDFYYPIHYLVWLLAGKALPSREIVTYKGEIGNNNIENLILKPIEEA